MEEKRRKAEDDRVMREVEYRKRHEEFKKRAATISKEEKAAQAKRARAVALKLQSTSPTKESYVLPPKGVTETEMNWSGTLGTEALNVSGSKKETLLTLKTQDGNKIVFTKKSVVDFSLSGVDLSLSVGKEMSISGKASARKTSAGTVHVVSKIVTATLKSSAIYDDLME